MSGNATTYARRDADDQIACADAALLLDVPATALERWSRQLAFPSEVGQGDGPRFRRDEIDALHATLAHAHSVEGAIREARRKLGR